MRYAHSFGLETSRNKAFTTLVVNVINMVNENIEKKAKNSFEKRTFKLLKVIEN
jgi:hypothetical protein